MKFTTFMNRLYGCLKITMKKGYYPFYKPFQSNKETNNIPIIVGMYLQNL